MKFTKVQGLGNDFVLVNGLVETDLPDYSQLAVRVCDRNFGVGADGLVIVLPSESADLRMRIFNPDGSEPEMCGNAIRCFGKYVYEQGLTTKTVIKVETLAGIIIPELIFDGDKITGVKVDMGEPILERARIPMNGPAGQVVNEALSVAGKDFYITAVSMGNPHCISFVEDADSFPITTYGPQLETHPVFPRKTNVEFVQVVSPEEVIMRVWERGAGVTLACGTGACATGVACVLNGKTNRKVTVHLSGGDLQIEWAEANNHVYMTGPAEIVFDGNYYL